MYSLWYSDCYRCTFKWTYSTYNHFKRCSYNSMNFKSLGINNFGRKCLPLFASVSDNTNTFHSITKTQMVKVNSHFTFSSNLAPVTDSLTVINVIKIIHICDSWCGINKNLHLSWRILLAMLVILIIFNMGFNTFLTKKAWICSTCLVWYPTIVNLYLFCWGSGWHLLIILITEW